MKKIFAFLFMLGTAYPLLNCMEKETLAKSVQAPAKNTEYRELKDELDDRINNAEGYIADLMRDYSLSRDEAIKKFHNANYELYRKVYDAYFKAKNK